MVIYIIAEHYPNPYKPQFDTEFAHLVRQGHEIQIYVNGKYDSTLHPRVLKYSLHKKVILYPSLRSLHKFLIRLSINFIKSPLKLTYRSLKIINRKDSIKRNIIRIARMMIFPINAPDLCYIHNIAAVERIDFLHKIYPKSRMALYYHGGEVGGEKKNTRDTELFNSMDIVFSNTEFSKNQAIKRGCDKDIAISLPVAFDLSDYCILEPKIFKKQNRLSLISIGRLSEEKGLIYALDAIKMLKDTHDIDLLYTIVGNGTQEQELKEYTKKQGLNEIVHFAGELDKSGVVNKLLESDVLILPSLITETWAETQAAVVQEAMFCKTLVIATNVGGVPESSASVLHQFSVPVSDPQAIYKMLAMINNLTSDEYTSISEEAYNFAISKFDIEKIGPKFIDLVMNDKKL